MKPQHFLIALLVVIGFFLLKLFQPFLKPIIVAFLLAIATNTINRFLNTKIQNKFLISIFMTLMLGCLFFIPIGYFLFIGIDFFEVLNHDQIAFFADNIRIIFGDLIAKFAFLQNFIPLDIFSMKNEEIIEHVVAFSGEFGKLAFSFVIDMTLILVFYFLFNLYDHQMSNYIKNILPFRKQDTNELFFETANVMSVVFYSILVTAIFQGILFGVFVSFFNYDGILFGILYGFASLIPIVGGALMWIPLSGYEFYSGNEFNAIVIAAYTVIVISIIADTFIKPLVIKYINLKVVQNPTTVNELLIFFSIVAGLGTFGFWGMIIGPALVTLAISILKLLKQFME